MESKDYLRIVEWEYKIVDSEFEEKGIAAGVVMGVGRAARCGVAVINTYEKRGLNVALNLMKAFIWYKRLYGYTIQEMIAWHKANNSKYAKYADEVEKYLLLT